MEPKQLDPKHSAELLRHLDKQHQMLRESHALMFNDLQKLQVEEEMLMRKLYEVMSPHAIAKKDDNMVITNRDDTMDNHVENEQSRTLEVANGDKIAIGNDTMDKRAENEQDRTVRKIDEDEMANGDDTMDKHVENEQYRTSKIDSRDDTVEEEENRTQQSARG